jgi:hypothetical protein
MTSTFDIERIVRDVIAEMTQGQSATSAETLKLNDGAKISIENTLQHNPSELTLATRLVTLNDVAGRLAGVRRLVLRTGAIVTPAVNDEIRNRNIQVTFTSAAKDAAGPLRLAMIAVQTRLDLQSLGADLQSGGIDVEQHSSKCLLEAIDRMAGEVAKRDTLGVIITPREAESLCLANRLPDVRAILGKDAAQVAADADAVGANVLIVNPKQTGTYALRRILGEYCRGGVRLCPEILKQRLKTMAK